MVKALFKDNSLIIPLSRDYLTLSTTTYGGGLKVIDTVVFTQVSKEFNEDPLEYSRRVLKSLSLSSDRALVFLTATEVREKYVIKELKNPNIVIAVTVGIDPLACIGGLTRRVKDKSLQGTINIFVAVDEPLSVRSLAELLALVSSVKTLALTDLCLLCDDNKRAFSSAVDAVAVACLSDSLRDTYVGPITRIGSKVSKVLYDSIVELSLKDLSSDSKFRSI